MTRDNNLSIDRQFPAYTLTSGRSSTPQESRINNCNLKSAGIKKSKVNASIYYTKKLPIKKTTKLKMSSAKGSILVTGANGGLGSAIVQNIIQSPTLAKSYHGLYTVRSADRADAVQGVLKKAEGHTYDLVPLDLSSLSSTRKVAEDINRRVAEGSVPPIRALVLNAAWQEYTTQTMTGDGFDMTFQATHLSHFLLALLLLKSLDKENGRVVVLGSWTHE